MSYAVKPNFYSIIVIVECKKCTFYLRGDNLGHDLESIDEIYFP